MQATMTTTRQSLQTIRTAGDLAADGTEATTPERRPATMQSLAPRESMDAWVRHASRANGFGDGGF